MHFRTLNTLGALCVSLFIALPVSAMAAQDCAKITRNLSLGMSGADVLLLQQMLNQEQGTRVAESGPGAPGFETTYFGPRTKLAVITFQNLFATEVLAPAGLTVGSGFVGTFTRAKLLVMQCKGSSSSLPVSLPPVTSIIPAVIKASSTVTTTSSTNTSISVPEATVAAISTGGGFHSDTPVLMSPSTYTAPHGTSVTLSTIGIASSGNIVHLDDYIVKDVLFGTDGQLSFVVPQDAPRGKHALWVSSSKGDTNKTFLIVTPPAVSPPVVSSATPTEGFFGTKVTVTGSGFLPQGNTVHISYGDITGIPSADGKTLQFSVSPNLPLSPGENRPEFDISIPYWFYVVNDNGLSEPLVFNLKI